MPIPTYDVIMLPLLRYCGDDNEHSLTEAWEALVAHFQLTDAEMEERIPSNRQSLFYNRLCWAKTYLKKAGLLVQPKRGSFSISEKGKAVLKESPETLTVNYLRQFEDFDNFYVGSTDDGKKAEEAVSLPAAVQDSQTPEEKLYERYFLVRQQTASDLLERLMEAKPVVLENIVIELMQAMGYGNSHKEAAQAIGKSGDRGVDGVIHMDRLGLDRVYIQAKRYQSPIGSPEIRNFGGALDQHKATKGVFITTSSFTNEARLCAKEMSRQIVLIDGDKLTDLMLSYNIGVKVKDTLVLHDIEPAYFDEF